MARRQAVAVKPAPPKAPEGVLDWRVPAGPAAFLTFAWGVFVFVLYCQRMHVRPVVLSEALAAAALLKLPNPIATHAALGLGLAAWLIAASAAAGGRLLDRFAPDGSRGLFERFALGSALGLGLVSAAVFVLGVAGL